MLTMTITEYWNCDGIPRGEVKAALTFPNMGEKSAVEAAKTAARRFNHRLVWHKGTEAVFDEGLFVQRIQWRDHA